MKRFPILWRIGPDVQTFMKVSHMLNDVSRENSLQAAQSKNFIVFGDLRSIRFAITTDPIDTDVFFQHLGWVRNETTGSSNASYPILQVFRSVAFLYIARFVYGGFCMFWIDQSVRIRD